MDLLESAFPQIEGFIVPIQECFNLVVSNSVIQFLALFVHLIASDKPIGTEQAEGIALMRASDWLGRQGQLLASEGEDFYQKTESISAVCLRGFFRSIQEVSADLSPEEARNHQQGLYIAIEIFRRAYAESHP